MRGYVVLGAVALLLGLLSIPLLVIDEEALAGFSILTAMVLSIIYALLHSRAKRKEVDYSGLILEALRQQERRRAK